MAGKAAACILLRCWSLDPDSCCILCSLSKTPSDNWSCVSLSLSLVRALMADELRQPLLPDWQVKVGRLHGQLQRGIQDTSSRKLGAVEDSNEVMVTGNEIRAAAFTCSQEQDFKTFISDCLGRGKPVSSSLLKPLGFMKCGKGSSVTSCSGTEGSRKRMRCRSCHGQGALLHRKVLRVNWRTILRRHVCATKCARSVPDEVFHRARGVRLHQSQSYQCEPACFLISDGLSKFSESVISERTPIPESARVICERHQISLIPITRVVMINKRKAYKFYILGLSREVYSEDYPSSFFSLCGICNIC